MKLIQRVVDSWSVVEDRFAKFSRQNKRGFGNRVYFYFSHSLVALIVLVAVLLIMVLNN